MVRRNFLSDVFNGLMLMGVSGLLSSHTTPLIDASDDLERIRKLIGGKDPLKWVFAGDSITQGAKHTLGLRSYPEIFAERMRWEMRRVRDLIINSAVSGNTTADILKDYQWRISQFSPAVVFLMIGTNDSLDKKNITVSQFASNLKEIVALVRKENAVLVLQTPNITIEARATGRERLPEYIMATKEVATEQNIILIDHWNYWKEKAAVSPALVFEKWLNDELHPNGRGHDEMAKLLFRKLGIFDNNAFTCQEHWLND